MMMQISLNMCNFFGSVQPLYLTPFFCLSVIAKRGKGDNDVSNKCSSASVITIDFVLLDIEDYDGQILNRNRRRVLKDRAGKGRVPTKLLFPYSLV